MKLILLTFVFSLSSSVDTASVKIELMSKVIHVKSSNESVNIDIRIKNDSTKNFLLYNFKAEPDQAFREESFFCNEEIAARPSIILYDENMKVIYARPARIPNDINYKPVTSQDVEEVIALEKIKFRDNLQVVLAKSSVVVSLKASLKQFRLEPGVYFIKVVYSSGAYNFNMIKENDIDEDKSKYEAAMFKGCIGSDTVRLIVEQNNK